MARIEDQGREWVILVGTKETEDEAGPKEGECILAACREQAEGLNDYCFNGLAELAYAGQEWQIIGEIKEA